MKINLNLLSIGYIILVGLICNILQMPDIVKAYLALPAFLILPQQVGELMFGVIKKIVGAVHFDFDQISRYIIAWLTGLIALFSSLILLVNLPYWNLNLYLIVLIASIVIFNIYKTSGLTDCAYNKLTETSKKSIIQPIIILIIIGIFSVALIKAYQPSPLLYNPGYNYFFKIMEFVEGDIFFIRLGHMPIIPLLIGLLSKLFNVHYMWVYSESYIVNFILFPIGIYLFSYEVSKSHVLSLFAAFLSPWIIGSLALHNFSTKSLLYVLFPFLLYVVHKSKMGKKHNFKDLLLLSSIACLITIPYFLYKVFMSDPQKNIFFFSLPILVLLISNIFQRSGMRESFLVISIIAISVSTIHNFEAPFIILLLCMYILIINIGQKTIIMNVLFVSIIIFIFLQLFNILDFEQHFFMSRFLFGDTYNNQWFDMDFHSKYNWFSNLSPYTIIILFYFGLIISFLKNEYKTISLLCIIALFLFFLPEGHFQRVIYYMAPLLAFIVSYIFIFIINQIKHTSKKKVKIISTLCILLIIILTIPPLVEHKYSFITRNLNSDNHFSYSNLYELNASFWIYENTPKTWIKKTWWSNRYSNESIIIHPPTLGGKATVLELSTTNDTLLISDPYTMFMMQGLTGRDQAIDGRVWIDENEYAPELIEQMENIKYNIFLANNSEIAHKEIQNIKRNHETILIIVSERTSQWLKNDNKMFIWQPPNKLENRFIELFNDELYFELVYTENNRIYIYRTKT